MDGGYTAVRECPRVGVGRTVTSECGMESN